MPKTFVLPARGAAGEPVDLARTFLSHGMAALPPMWVDEETPAFGVTFSLRTGRARSTKVAISRKGDAAVEIPGRPPGMKSLTEIESVVRHVLRFDEDLSEFYALAADDPDLSWVTSGAGRMI